MPKPAATRFPVLLAALSLLASGSGCLFSDSGHGGSDTETLTGVLLAPDGRPAANARVRLVPAAYDPVRPAPGHVREARTDAGGRYGFPKAPSDGRYNLIAADAQDDHALYRGGLPADTLPDTLRLSAAWVLYISLHGDVYQAADSGKAWFPGTDILVHCDGDAATRLPGVPRGMEAMVIESRAGWRHEFTRAQPGNSLEDSLAIHADSNRVTIQPY